MPFIARSGHNIEFCSDTNRLLTAKGDFIARMYEMYETEGIVRLSLGMCTHFESENSSDLNCCGWNGCEEHVAQYVWFDEETKGALSFIKNRNRMFNKSEEPGEEIIVDIEFVNVVIPQLQQAKKRGFIESIRKFFCGSFEPVNIKFGGTR